MTFIASVIAKDGVAIIADSLVTTSSLSLDWGTFLKFIKDKSDTGAFTDSTYTVDAKEVSDLFSTRASHTRDYEEKLFQLDNFTAITTAGNAIINGKRIRQIIDEFKSSLKAKGRTAPKKLENKISMFCEHVEKEIRVHLADNDWVDATTFILTSFSTEDSKTEIYRINTVKASKGDLGKVGFDFVTSNKEVENMKVVCSGQNRISEMILFGGIHINLQICRKVFEFMKNDLSLTIDDEEAYLGKLFPICLSNEFTENMSIHKLTNLSLQQAVDLAALLMNLEISFQKYTKNIPTVGGVVKIAIINKDGFKFISGNEIHAPTTG